MQTIGFEVKPSEAVDNFKSFEKELIKKVRQELVMAVGRYLEDKDETLSGQFKREHPDYHYAGQVSRTLRFYYGSMRIKRRRYR